MDLSTATGLAAAVLETLNRQDLAATVPAWIQMAEAGFNQTLRLRPMIKREHAVFAGAFATLPSDFLEMKSVSTTWLNRPTKLIYGSEENLDDLQAHFGWNSHPTHFAIIGNEIEIAPVRSNANWDVAMTYYARIPALDTTGSGTNWLLQKSPQLYLYTALLHSAPYLVEDDRLQVWEGLAQAALQALQAEDESSSQNGSQLIEKFRPIG